MPAAVAIRLSHVRSTSGLDDDLDAPSAAPRGATSAPAYGAGASTCSAAASGAPGPPRRRIATPRRQTTTTTAIAAATGRARAADRALMVPIVVAGCGRQPP